MVRVRINLGRLGALAAAALLGAGCSGINLSHGVSPATFLLPGLMQAPPSAVPVEDSSQLPELVPVVESPPRLVS